MSVMRLVETGGLIGIKLMEVQWPGGLDVFVNENVDPA